MSVTITNERGVARIELGAPPNNALSWSMLLELESALTAMRRDPGLRVVVVQSTGRNFCVGADLRDPELAGRFIQREGARDIAYLGFRVFEALASLPVPVVCAARGWVVGGGLGLFGLADFRIAAHNVEVALPEIDRGLHVAWGLLHRLRPRFSADTFRRLSLLGESLPVGALDTGFATCCEDDKLEESCEGLVETLREKPAPAMRAIVASLRDAEAGLEPRIEEEAARFVDCATSQECRDVMMRWMGQA